MSKKSAGVMLLVIVLVVALDQLSKFMVLKALALGQVIQVVPRFFSLTLTYNPGIAFGFLADSPNGFRLIALWITTLAALGVVFYLLFNDYRRNPLGQAALAMVVGGALGNIIDRLRYGQVVVIVQDGVVIQVDRTERRRLRMNSRG